MDSASPHTPYITLVGASGGNVLTERFIHSTGLRDTVAYGPLDDNDGTPGDVEFGQGGSIKIDFGSTSGITTDGGRAIAMRPQRDENGNIIAYDILVGGYTFDAGTGKYKIALVDLLDDNMFHVT